MIADQRPLVACNDARTAFLAVKAQVAVHFLTFNRIKTYRIGLGEQISALSNDSVAGTLSPPAFLTGQPNDRGRVFVEM